MKKWKKIVIVVVALAVIATVAYVSVQQANKDVVTVQTGKVTQQDITSVVTASGEVKPKTYANVLGEGYGKITGIVVAEGDHVRKGDVLLKLENIQPTADVEGQNAALQSAEAAVRSADASFKSAVAAVAQSRADLERAKFDWGRAQDLYKEGLIPKSQYDATKSAYDGSSAAVDVSSARLTQTRAQLDQSRSQLDQTRALLARTKDVLRKTTYTAPIDGIVTYIAVRVGENVVMGIQSSPGSYLMTISDMSVATAEVKVDETDIVNVKNGQEGEVTIDAFPGKTFKGRVTEVGTQAVLRTSGQTTSQVTTGSQEARDFKVVITLDNPPETLRPGLSTTAKIRTAERKNVLAIPMQALAVRTRFDIAEAEKAMAGKKNASDGSVTLAAAKAPAGGDPKKEEIQGVFVVRNKKAMFVAVETGITGITEIEITKGLQKGDEIITGSYRALRTLRHGATVKVDNATPGGSSENQSS